jgi:hypothetical protein
MILRSLVRLIVYRCLTSPNLRRICDIMGKVTTAEEKLGVVKDKYLEQIEALQEGLGL